MQLSICSSVRSMQLSGSREVSPCNCPSVHLFVLCNCPSARKCTEVEAKRPSRDLEAGGICWAMQKLRPYLICRPFTVLNDNSSLMWVAKYKGTNRRLWNYSCIFADYNFSFKYRKGASMGDCDWLSRFPLPAEPNDPADPDKDIDTNCGTDLVDSTIGGAGMVSMIERRQRQPRVGARNSYHCCKKGRGCNGTDMPTTRLHAASTTKLN